ncbi:MAG: hypothetical protein M3Z09_13045 [Acidobacteriota bacterium]|nr:hypothetical protein [Acidobacteriota bacterium]
MILGAWLAGSACIDLVAVHNFRAVERFMSDPGIRYAEQIHTAGRAETRSLLRHLAAEQNRFYFEQWEWVQLALGLSLLLLFVFGSRPPILSIVLCLAMLIIVLIDRFGLTPQITALGRSLDNLAETAQSGERKVFWVLHNAYSGLELVKLALGFGIAGRMIIRRKPDQAMFARESQLDDISRPPRAES